MATICNAELYLNLFHFPLTDGMFEGGLLAFSENFLVEW